ncbi:hypothetical protein WM40_07485 [Robbsia andropogonis]|uniref:AAA+ ATPase domain-containing protein n=1 Tax=Robbsia andropogonis TaxID=28092 RepID=A0A0F5K2D6_9BURK|nr:AAA family ATPase [Robbsia andropogonis]KKB64291.1 hypothetical protein WM40_07485 [Robbsia andropogonis]
MTSLSAAIVSDCPSSSAMSPSFPFVALVGQALLQQALLLVAVDAGIGGVLITGPRGTAKSTSARALAALLAPAPFVTLPLGASEAQLIGSLDLDAVLREGAARFAPGLLAKADGGVLYVDEVNLLPDALADALLDAAASGVNVVERDGVSHRHAARFVLIGTMNEEEGELRPQLSDRFGLSVLLENYADVSVRESIVRSRLAFDLDPAAFVAAHAAASTALGQRLHAARQRIGGLAFSDAVHRRVSDWCLAAAVDGVRADLVMLKAARAQAALDGDAAISVGHVDRVAPLVLLHRRQAEGRPATSHASASALPPVDTPASAAPSHSGTPSRDADRASGVEDGAREAAPSGRLSGSPGNALHASQDSGPSSMQQAHRRDETRPGRDTGTSPDGDPDRDWGYLAPEPVPVAQVKPVRAYDPKKV